MTWWSAVWMIPTLLPLGCSDSTVSSFNTPPSALISYPADGAVFAEGDSVAMQGVVGDDDSPATDLTASWRVDGIEVCGPTAEAEASPDEQGDSRCEVVLEIGSHELSLVVEDPGGQAGQDVVNVSVQATAAPSAGINSPEDGSVVTAGDLVSLTGQVADLEDGASQLSVWWTVDGEDLDVDVAVDSDGAVTSATTFTEAAEHSIGLHVQDSDGKTGSDTVTLSVQAAAGSPTCSLTGPADGVVVDVADGVSLVGNVSDPDQAAETLSVSWQSDIQGTLGNSTPDSKGAVSFAASLTQADHTVSMLVTDDSGLTCSDFVTVVVDAAPAISFLAPASGTVVQQGSAVSIDLLASDERDSADALTVVVQSDIDGVLSTASPDSSGDLSLSQDLSVGTHSLTATATDTHGFWASDSTLVTVNGQPTAPELQVSPATATTSDSLTATITTASIDAEGGTPTLSYGWTRDGEATTHSSATVASSATSKGQLWVVSVVASDGDGGSSDPGTASITINDSPPQLDTLSLTPSVPTVDDSLSANASGSDEDGDTVSFSYAWAVDSSTVSGSSATLSSGFAKNQTVTVTVTPTADGTDGDPDTASVDIQNTPPTAPVVSMSPTDPIAGTDTLTCAVDSFSTDADGDSISYAVAWTVDGVASSVSGYSVSRSLTGAGDFWVCTVTPSDDETTGTSASASVTVLGDPVDYAHTQWPCSATAAAGDSLDVYGWVYMTGVTDSAGQGAGIDGQLGVGDDTDDPTTDGSSWTWVDATYNADKDGLAPGDLANDEYVATLTAPATAGDYRYAARFTTDGGASWVYGDLGDDCGGSGSIDGFDLATAGSLTVD